WQVDIIYTPSNATVEPITRSRGNLVKVEGLLNEVTAQSSDSAALTDLFYLRTCPTPRSLSRRICQRHETVDRKIRNGGRGALLGWNYVGDRGALLEGDTGDKDRGAVSEVVGAEDEGAPLEGWLVWRTRELRRRGVVGVRDDGALAGRSGWCRGRGSCVRGVVLAGDKGAVSEGWSLQGTRELPRKGMGSSLGRLQETRFYVNNMGAPSEGWGRLGFYVNDMGAPSDSWRRLDFYVNKKGAPLEGWRRLDFYVNDMGAPLEGWSADCSQV
ncbi:hypothetical protein FA13DRAFT_1722488, partial [Coprinellus micaceus]